MQGVKATLFILDGHRMTAVINRDINHFRRGDIHHLGRVRRAHRFHLHLHRHGSSSDLRGARVETDHVAHEHGLMEDDLAHRHRDEFAVGKFMSLDRARLVNVAENDAAEDGALRVGVAWEKDDADGGVTICFGGVWHRREVLAFTPRSQDGGQPDEDHSEPMALPRLPF